MSKKSTKPAGTVPVAPAPDPTPAKPPTLAEALDLRTKDLATTQQAIAQTQQQLAQLMQQEYVIQGAITQLRELGAEIPAA